MYHILAFNHFWVSEGTDTGIEGFKELGNVLKKGLFKPKLRNFDILTKIVFPSEIMIFYTYMGILIHLMTP